MDYIYLEEEKEKEEGLIDFTDWLFVYWGPMAYEK